MLAELEKKARNSSDGEEHGEEADLHLPLIEEPKKVIPAHDTKQRSYKAQRKVSLTEGKPTLTGLYPAVHRYSVDRPRKHSHTQEQSCAYT